MAGKYQAAQTNDAGAVVYQTAQGWVIECECLDYAAAERIAARMNAQAHAAAVAAMQRQALQRAAAVLGRGRPGVRYFEPDIYA